MQRDPYSFEPWEVEAEFRQFPSKLQQGLLRLGQLVNGRGLCHFVCRFEDSELCSVHESKLKLKYRRGTVVE